MPSNHGKLNEDEMMLALNNHMVKDLIPNLRYLLQELFGALEANEIVTCTQPEIPIKPDLLITYKGITKGVSVKTGTSEFVHGEPIEKFTIFLKELGISDKTIRTLLLNQFGDGSVDGTGKERMPLYELKYQLAEDIREANTELNSNSTKLIKIFDRLVFSGWNKEVTTADAIYHGDMFNGIVATKTQITKWLEDKYWDYYDNLHIGPIFLRPHARYIGVEVKNEFYRHKIDGFWTNMLADIRYISGKYFSYTPINKRKSLE